MAWKTSWNPNHYGAGSGASARRRRGRGFLPSSAQNVAPRNERAHTLQRWMNLPGDVRMTGEPLAGHRDAIHADPGRSFEHLLPGRDRAFFYVPSGGVTGAGHPVRADQPAWSDPVPEAAVSAPPSRDEYLDQSCNQSSIMIT